MTARWIHAPPPMKVAETGGSGPSSSSLSPCAGGDLWQQQKTQQPVDFSFYFLCFLNLLRFFLFRSAPFLCLLLLRIFFTAGRFVMGLSSSPLFRVADRAALQCAESDSGSVAALLDDSVDGADGSVGVLLAGLHPCRW